MPWDTKHTICWAGWAVALLALGEGGGVGAVDYMHACMYSCTYDDLVQWL